MEQGDLWGRLPSLGSRSALYQRQACGQATCLPKPPPAKWGQDAMVPVAPSAGAQQSAPSQGVPAAPVDPSHNIARVQVTAMQLRAGGTERPNGSAGVLGKGGGEEPSTLSAFLRHFIT